MIITILSLIYHIRWASSETEEQLSLTDSPTLYLCHFFLVINGLSSSRFKMEPKNEEKEEKKIKNN